jgi:flagellar hook protein FlgE
LTPKRGNLFESTLAAGAMTVGTVGSLGAQTGMVVGSVEGSNVNEERQFSDMIVTQQAYTLASQVFKTANEMTSTVSQLVV